MRTETVVKQIGSVLGEFVEWENKGEDNWGRFMRITVIEDLEKPLKNGTILKNKGGKAYRIPFKFERLLDFCYICGKVGHLLKDCSEKEQEDDGDSSNLSFGPWMRAIPTRMRQGADRDMNINKKKLENGI